MSPAEQERPAPAEALQPVQATARSLLRSTALAAVIAAVVLMTVVLPLAYGFDPTGIGRVFGFTPKGLAKMAVAREEIAEADANAAAEDEAVADTSGAATASTDLAAAGVDSSRGETTHETTISLNPGEGKEVKLVMRRGASARYSWVTDGGGVNYLTHGDTANAPANTYHTYGRGADVRADSGLIEAAFDGNHGWFWRNRTAQRVTVTLRTTGEYTEVKKP